MWDNIKKNIKYIKKKINIYWKKKLLAIKLCIELKKLKRTIKKYNINLYNKSILNKYNIILYLFMCKKKHETIKKFKDIISIKSQLHHPPQFNSCSAHQDPKKIEKFK